MGHLRQLLQLAKHRITQQLQFKQLLCYTCVAFVTGTAAGGTPGTTTPTGQAATVPGRVLSTMAAVTPGLTTAHATPPGAGAGAATAGAGAQSGEFGG